MEAFQNLKGQEAGICREASKELVEESACRESKSLIPKTSPDTTTSVRGAITTMATLAQVMPGGGNSQRASGRGAL